MQIKYLLRFFKIKKKQSHRLFFQILDNCFTNININKIKKVVLFSTSKKNVYFTKIVEKKTSRFVIFIEIQQTMIFVIKEIILST